MRDWKAGSLEVTKIKSRHKRLSAFIGGPVCLICFLTQEKVYKQGKGITKVIETFVGVEKVKSFCINKFVTFYFQ